MKLSPSKGEIEKLVVQREDGKICPHFFLESDSAKRFSDMSRLGYDLWNANNLIDLIDSVEQNDIKEALWKAAVISYRRCFSRSDGRAKLDISHVKKADPEWIEFHKMVTNLRNDYIAHANKTELEDFKVSVALHPPEERKGIMRIDHHLVGRNLIPKEELDKFAALCLALLGIVKEMEKTAAYQAMDELNQCDIEELYERTET